MMTVIYSKLQEDKALDGLRKMIEKGDISPSGGMQDYLYY